MNVALKFVEALGNSIAGRTAGAPMHAVMATPRFESSRNVVFLLGPRDDFGPTLVAKVARLGGNDQSLTREANNLLALERCSPGSPSVPRLVAHGLFEGHQILLETAVSGEAMTPDLVRRRPDECIDAVIDWLIAYHTTPALEAEVNGSLPALVQEPLRSLRMLTSDLPQAGQLIERVCLEAEVLKRFRIPTVFEHGDLSAPNLMLQGAGKAGVVDWELSVPYGLPAVDVFFFLAFAANAMESARTPEACAQAFSRAFFGPHAWARRHVRRYASAVGLPAEALPALFLLCWTRYLVTIPQRSAWALRRENRSLNPEGAIEERYWRLWLHAVENINAFGCQH